MEAGVIDLGTVPGGMDLQATLESGQTFLWNRLDGLTYQQSAPSGGSAWYRTVHGSEVIEARQVNGAIEWRATTDGTDSPQAIAPRRRSGPHPQGLPG